MRALAKFITALCIVAASGVCFAQTQATKDELKAAVDEANAALVKGPHEIPILDEAKLSLPADAGFVPAPAAIRYLRALGNSVDEKSLVGLIVPEANDQQWFAVLMFEKGGYVRDDDAKHWNPDEILKSLRDGTEHSNPSRKDRGLPEVEVAGWAEPPAYDATTHRLIWSAIVRSKGQSDDAQNGVNYRTIALGRDGYLSLTMVSPLSKLPANKQTANALLADIAYVDGKRYADFNASTDHIAEYGLAALIAGVAVKKLGLFAVIAAFALKFFKVALVALLAFGTKIKRLFARKSKAASAPPSGPDFIPPSSPIEPKHDIAAAVHDDPSTQPHSGESGHHD